MIRCGGCLAQISAIEEDNPGSIRSDSGGFGDVTCCTAEWTALFHLPRDSSALPVPADRPAAPTESPATLSAQIIGSKDEGVHVSV